MAIREIRKKGDPCLEKVCHPVTEFNERLHLLLDDMRETLEESGGVGLAAPQVGILRRVCIVEDSEGEIIELVNPEIVKAEGEQTGLEGCLSLPGRWGIVIRPYTVRVRAQDRDGATFEVEDEDITARCFCHEIEHLDGHLFSEHCDRLLTDEELEQYLKEHGRVRKGRRRMRIVFMGTPDFAVASLRRLVEDRHEVVGVFTQPDKPKNRGMKLTFSPVKEYALTQDLPVYQPLKMRDGEALGILRELAPELIVVAYGKILPQEILDLPQYGCINVHSSLLPKYRGAAPINWAILNGERITGVSIMYMVAALDAGDVIRTVSTEIGEHEDAAALTERLTELGAQALSETIPTLADGTAKRTPQDESAFTYAPMLDRSLSPIDWTRSAREIDCQVRGLIPWPCAATSVDGKSVKVYETLSGEMTADAPGTMHAVKRGLSVACGDGRSLIITQLQAEGGKRMAAADYLRGHPLKTNG